MINISNIILIYTLLVSMLAGTQTNTAVSSDIIGKCALWNYPYMLYKISGATQNLNKGMTFTVDQTKISESLC